MIYFVKQLLSVGFRLFRTDGLFRLAALLYMLAGSLLALFGSDVPTLFVWNLAILFSILFLAFTGRPATTRKKIFVSSSAALLFYGVHIGVASLKLGLCPWQTLLAYDNWWMTVSLLSLLFGVALRSPNESRPFDELAPFRLLRFMMEAGLITGAITALSYIDIPILLFFCQEGTRLDLLSRNLFVFLLCTFCPLYTACRLMSPQGREVKPGKVFLAALSLGWAPLIASFIFLSHVSALTFLGKPSPNAGVFASLSFGLLAWFALAFVPKSVQEQDPLASKIFEIFRTILPYIGILPFVYMVLIHMQKWRVKFLLSDHDFWEVLMATAFFLTTLVWRKRRPISQKAVFQVFSLVALASCFWPPAVWNSRHAERVVFTKLQRLGAVDSQGKIVKTDFKMKLSSDEENSFMLAVMALINDTQPSQRVRTLLQQVDDCQQQKQQLEGKRNNPKKKENRSQILPHEVLVTSPCIQARFKEMSQTYRNFLAFCHITFPIETCSLRFEQNQKLRLEAKYKEGAPYSLKTWLKKESEFKRLQGKEAVEEGDFLGKHLNGGQQQNG